MSTTLDLDVRQVSGALGAEIRGLDVAITTTAQTDEQAEALLRALGLPIATEAGRD